MTRLMPLVVAIAAACSSSERPGPKQCEKLREHIVELTLAEATGVDRVAHREAMRGALGDQFVESCTSSLTDSQVDCGLKAADVSAASACATTR